MTTLGKLPKNFTSNDLFKTSVATISVYLIDRTSFQPFARRVN